MATPTHPGETLRKAREGRSLALDDVAAALNLSPTALRNLESGAFERLPGHTFARGYIRAYAKFLGMEQDLLVREFDQITGSDATGSSINSLQRIEEPARVPQGLLRLLSLVVLSILLVAGFIWWQDQESVDADVSLSSELAQVEIESANGTTQIHPLEPESQAVELTRQETLPLPLEEPAEIAGEQPSAAASLPAPVAATSAPTVVPPAVPVAPVAPAAPVVPAAPADAVQEGVQAAAGEGLLSIRFTANCWTQVTDADGKVLLSALRKPGENINLAVKLPLELRLGYAAGAQVAFNRETVDTAPFTTGETARIKLGQ